jgi:hypothetical protein
MLYGLEDTMNFNIYLDDETGKRLIALAEREGESRNSLIRKAVKNLLDRPERPTWPESVLRHEGFPDFPEIGSKASELLAPSDDPLA